jgi:glycosyltransferase involved in cell wall biosynthesis
MPRVSVVMPAYNAAWCIAAAVSSVLWQTYRDVELVVVDDGSSDGTADLVRAFDGPVTVVTQENAGVGAARNRGIEAAGGELITFLDADDIAFARHVEALVAVFDRSGGIATANAYWLFPGGVDRRRTRFKGRFPRPDEQRRAILEQNFVSTMSLFPRSLAAEIGPFDEDKRHAEDWDFWLRAVFGGHRVHLQAEPLALYRWGAASLSSAVADMDASVRAIFEGLEERYDLTEVERAYVRRRFGGEDPRVLSRNGDDALRAGRYSEAARLYRRAAQMCPSERMLVWKSRVLSAAPPIAGPLVRSRQLRIEAGLGFDQHHVR